MHLAIVTLLLLAASAPAQTRQDYDRAQCRLSFGNSVRDLAAVTALRVQTCHRQRMQGKLSPAIACNDPSTWSAAGYPTGAATMARDLSRYAAESAHCSAGIATPPDAGYSHCPAPCQQLPVTSFAELGECLACVTFSAGLPALSDLLGTPPAPGVRAPRKCQETIGRGVVRYVNKRMNLQHGCQFLKEVAKAELVSSDCRDASGANHPYSARSERAGAKLRKQIERRCATADTIAALDTCAGDSAGLAACVLAAADAWTDTLFDSIYPTL